MEHKQEGVSAPVQHTPPQPSEQEAPSAVQAEAASAGAAGQSPVESGRSSAGRAGQPSEQEAVPAAQDLPSAEKGAPPAAQELSASGKGVQPAEGGQYSKAALKKQRRKNIVWGVIAAVIIACVISVLFQLSQTLAGGDAATFAEVMRGMNWWLLLPVAALFIIMFVMETLKFTILGKTGGYPLSFGKGAKVALVGKFYECITPFSSGGQPMQIYYMYRQGIPATAATSVTMVKYGIHMLGFTFVAALVMGFGVPQLSAIPDEAMRTTVLVCGWVGFGINAFIPVFVTIVVFLPGLVKWVVNLFVKLLHAVRIVKNPDKWEAKMRQWIDDFAAISQFIYKKPKEFFVLFLLCLGEPSIELVQPYLLLVAMCGPAVMGYEGAQLLWLVMVLAMYSTYAATFIPTPGNSGAIEMVFMAAFAGLTESVLFWYVLIWRFVLYYTWLILGLGMNACDGIAALRRRHKKQVTSL